MNIMNEPPTHEQQICDLQAALKRLGGNVELLREMIGFYLEDYQTLLQRIASAADSGDPTSLSRHVHSLKGLAANFDATEVIEATKSVTLAARAGFGRAPLQEIDLLARAAEALAERLQRALEEDEFD